MVIVPSAMMFHASGTVCFFRCATLTLYTTLTTLQNSLKRACYCSLNRLLLSLIGYFNDNFISKFGCCVLRMGRIWNVIRIEYRIEYESNRIRIFGDSKFDQNTERCRDVSPGSRCRRILRELVLWSLFV